MGASTPQCQHTYHHPDPLLPSTNSASTFALTVPDPNDTPDTLSNLAREGSGVRVICTTESTTTKKDGGSDKLQVAVGSDRYEKDV